jgi:hypothetical protein
MRAWVLSATLMIGCSFHVPGVNVPPGDPGGGGPYTPSPVASTPNPPSDADAGMSATAPPDMSAPPHMTAPRVGTACTDDTQCDPGLFCAKSFGIGAGRVDIPGGYCTLDCKGGKACPANSACATFSFGQFCVSSCPPDPCREGYQCCDVQGVHGCMSSNLCD